MPFKSTVGDYQTVATLETFGLPAADDPGRDLRPDRLHHCPRAGARCVEHVHPSRSMATYWSYSEAALLRWRISA
jgi:ribulose-bisphosphate carboxylase small chain